LIGPVARAIDRFSRSIAVIHSIVKDDGRCEASESQGPESQCVELYHVDQSLEQRIEIHFGIRSDSRIFSASVTRQAHRSRDLGAIVRPSNGGEPFVRVTVMRGILTAAVEL
jgi:hypothetical protein